MTAIESSRRPAMVAVAGIGALALGAVLVLLLHVLPPTDRISATRRTISEYGLGDGRWVFTTAVVLVALGSAVGLGALRYQGRLPTIAAVAGALWTAGLLVIAAFPKHDWASSPHSGVGGTVHRAASVVAFVCLPLAVLFAARLAFPRSPGRRLLARLLAIGSLAWFAVILGAVIVAAAGDGRWWLLIPLGLVERGMALTELLALSALLAPPSRLSTRDPRPVDLAVAADQPEPS